MTRQIVCALLAALASAWAAPTGRADAENLSPAASSTEALPDRAEIEANFKQDLDYWRGVIAAFAREAEAQTEERLQEETSRLRGAWEDAWLRLQDLRGAAEAHWTVARERFEAAYNDLENTWARSADDASSEQAQRPRDR
jgi:hypothetical protein